MKAIEKLFGVSVAVISLTTLITTVTGLIGLPLPRWALWIIGIVNLISLPLLIYSTVRSLREKAGTAGKAARKPAGRVEKAAPTGIPKTARSKPHPRQLAARKAATGNKPKKGKKKKK